MKLVDRITGGNVHGLHYAVSIFFATAVLWILMHTVTHLSAIWAVSSMVATSDPLLKDAVMFLRARVINTLAGCIVGLLFIVIGGPHVVSLPLAMAVTVLLSSYVIKIQTMWRQAPISAAVVIAAGMEHASRRNGLIAGVLRMDEVLLGCIIGIVVAWIVSVVWPLPEPELPEAGAKS